MIDTRSLPALLIAAALASACGDSPTTPSPAPPAISCPASLMLPSADGNAVVGTFALPQVSGGTAPVSTTCDRPSGSPFTVGTTEVTCSARDADRRTAACSFTVTVVRVPRIAATRFVAFGDSITEGATSSCNRVSPFMSFAQTMLVLEATPGAAWSYPSVLQELMRSRYAAQLPSVSNRGAGGESTASGTGRLPGVLAEEMPEVLLLQEGANDINSSRDPATIAANLRTMVRSARSRGVDVYLGTLLPQQPRELGSCRGFGSSNVAAANDRIRLVAASEQVTLVDLFQAFGGVPGDLIGPDGLHPSEAGYRRIAETFFAAVTARLER
ncbi:MAG: HYR domain-containing protein [Luteitalea sp.]|nr:HYR domain-containing protein [Luteitalea sp.]